MKSMIDFSQTYYELFGLPETLLVDRQSLRVNYRELQKKFHPDKFANEGSGEKRLAEQFSGFINTAYQTLSTPLLTAEYLLQLAGHEVDNENLTIDDGTFLFKQMEWRESLADMGLNDLKKAESNLESLSKEVVNERQQLQQAFLSAFENQHYSACVQVVAKWHFVEKMQSEIEQLEEKLFEEND